jgi:outer membrane receptor protein involved in Fe transport
VTTRLDYQSSANVYTAQLQHIIEMGCQTFVAGASGVLAEQGAAITISQPRGTYAPLLGVFDPVSVQDIDVSTKIATAYIYDYIKLFDFLQLVAGANYTYERMPVNTSSAPLSPETENRDQLSPKGALIWSPSPSQLFRVSYAQGLTGAGQQGDLSSVGLEPTHLAGAIQTFREPVPFSIVGQLNGARMETMDALWEGRFDDTYLAIGAQRLEVKRSRNTGLFIGDPDNFLPPTDGLISENVKFHENAVEMSIHQLLFGGWSFGAEYRASYARLERRYPDYIGNAVGLDEETDWRGWLHTVTLNALYRHHSGIFARSDAMFFAQNREQDSVSLDGDSFWQINFLGGYRFSRQGAEISIGVLNLLDRDYRLDPINHYADLPRSRTVYTRLSIDF